MPPEPPVSSGIKGRHLVAAAVAIFVAEDLLSSIDPGGPAVPFLALRVTFAISCWFAFQYAVGFREFDRTSVRRALTGFGVALIGIFALAGVGWALEPGDVTPGLAGWHGGLPTGPALFRFIAVFVVVTPIVEETVFRGFLYEFVVRRWGIAAAIGSTALLFALSHVEVGHDIRYLAYIAIGGVAFAGLRAWTHGLMIPMVFHAAINFLSRWAS